MDKIELYKERAALALTFITTWCDAGHDKKFIENEDDIDLFLDTISPYELIKEELQGPGRDLDVSTKRQTVFLALILLRRPSYSLSNIAKYFNREHSSLLACMRKCSGFCGLPTFEAGAQAWTYHGQCMIKEILENAKET